MTKRREREDGIAANQFVNASIIMGGITPEARQSAATAFLAGCAHVRTSAEWKAMSEAIHELRKYVLRDDCDADGAPDADNSRHGETCYYCSASTALHTLDRIRGDK